MNKNILIILLLSLFLFPLYSQETNQGENVEVAEEIEEVKESDQQLNLGENQNQEAVTGGVGGLQVISLLLGLLLVVFFIFFFFRYLKKLSQPSTMGKGSFFKIISSESLLGSRYLHIVKAGVHYYFISSTDGEVQLLEKIEDQEMIQSIELYIASVPEETQTFYEKLMSAMQNKLIKVSVEEKTHEVKEGFKKQRDKLKNL